MVVSMISKVQSRYAENRIVFENFDEGDRDCSIVQMHEKEGYRVNELAELANLHKSTISKIIHAWQDVPEDARKALEGRKITTNHARQLARVKAWPNEQTRLTKWLLDKVEKGSGVSSTQLGMIVNSVVGRKKHAKFVADDVELPHRMGTVDAEISEKTYDEPRAKMSKKLGKHKITKMVTKPKTTKKVMEEDHRGAGIERASRADLENIEQEILQYLHESVVRYGGAGQVSVRTISSVVSKRVKGLKNKGFLKRSVRDVLENLSWASFWGYGHQKRVGQENLGGRVYALEMGPAELAQVKKQLTLS